MMYFILTFFLGASVGSFVNVMIDRTILGEDWVSGRSHCDHCHKPLSWYDMIPIFSYLYIHGSSRCCHKPLSWRYPIVEALVGLLFVWWIAVGFLFFQLVSAPLTIVQPAFWLFTGIIMAILALSDLIYGYVLLPVVWVGALLTICYRMILWYYGAFQLVDLQISLLVAAVFFAFFWLLWRGTRGRGMAEGDMYVALYAGLLLGWPKGFVAVFMSFIIGAIVGILLIVTKVRSRKDTVPFVPFIIVAMATSLLYGEQIMRWIFKV